VTEGQSRRRPEPIQDLETFFDRVNHDTMMSLVRGGIADRRVCRLVREVVEDLRGWRQYFNYAFSKQTFRELTVWIKRRLRCYMWKQWGRAGYRELRKRGVSRDLAWNTCKSHHGPWRLSRSPALAYALTTGYFVEMGLPLLHVNE
jgi:RNA-directed DNA polymerase